MGLWKTHISQTTCKTSNFKQSKMSVPNVVFKARIPRNKLNSLLLIRNYPNQNISNFEIMLDTLISFTYWYHQSRIEDMLAKIFMIIYTDQVSNKQTYYINIQVVYITQANDKQKIIIARCISTRALLILIDFSHYWQ